MGWIAWHSQGFYTLEQLKARHKFEDLLTPVMMTLNETRAAMVTDFAGKMEAWADERYVENRVSKVANSGIIPKESSEEV